MSRIIIVLLLINIVAGQVVFTKIDSVSEAFKQKYKSTTHNYNPLQVGNVWQYYDSWEDRYDLEKIVKDTVLNNKTYYKRITRFYHNFEYLSRWERNDPQTGVTYFLDIEDTDGDGDNLEEFLIDSLEAEVRTRYISWKHCFPSYACDGIEALIHEKGWSIVWSDTVQYVIVEYSLAFSIEAIADKYGLLYYQLESPTRYLTGAIIDSVLYGTIVGIENTPKPLPKDFELGNNYPNPFNPQTTISFSVPESKHIRLTVYNLHGQKIKTLVSGRLSAGQYNVIFSSKGLSSGVYYYTLQTPQKSISKRMLLIK